MYVYKCLKVQNTANVHINISQQQHFFYFCTHINKICMCKCAKKAHTKCEGRKCRIENGEKTKNRTTATT